MLPAAEHWLLFRDANINGIYNYGHIMMNGEYGLCSTKTFWEKSGQGEHAVGCKDCNEMESLTNTTF